MIDLLFQITLNNVSISLVLAILAAIVGALFKRPVITHLLWLLVFLKLLTPPVLSISVIPIPWMGVTASTAGINIPEDPEIKAAQVDGVAGNQTPSKNRKTALLVLGKQWLLLGWLSGSLIVFFWSLLQIYRFNQLLRIESKVGNSEIQSMAARIASPLGLKDVPTIYVTSANVSPMVWWIGGEVWVVIPAALYGQMNAGQFQWILSHELAHVRRRDYMVRGIEWLACVCFWWNPITWWARFNLRANEEICCDTLVVSSLKPKPYIYGDSLLQAVEILACPAHRPPAMTSGINSGELLKRRVKMIVSKNVNRSNLRWLQACILLGSLIVLPLGLTNAQDQSTVQRDRAFSKTESTQKARRQLADTETAIERVLAAVEAEEISPEDGKTMLAAYVRERQAREKTLKTDLAAAEAEVGEAVRTGGITPEEATARLRAMNPEGNVGLSEVRRGSYPPTEYVAVLEAAVADGIITQEYIENKLAEFENVQYEKFVQKLKADVAAGKITQEQAAAMTADLIEFLRARREQRQRNWKLGVNR